MLGETWVSWITLAVTLALSILVPLFTQIANNCHQRKMLREKLHYEELQQRRSTFVNFMLKVGAAITHSSHDNLPEAGAALYQMYMYSPSAWWKDLDSLAEYLRKYDWERAGLVMQKLSRLISEELEPDKKRKRK